MSCSVRIQPTAHRELEDIVSYLASLSPQVARSFTEEWRNMLELLKDGTVIHRLSRFESLARLGYRTVLVKSYVVLYFREDDNITIAHVFHQSQDYANLVIG